MGKKPIDQHLVDVMAKADAMAFDKGQSALNPVTEHANQLLDNSAQRCHEKMRKGRGAALNPKGRFENLAKTDEEREINDYDEVEALKTTVQLEAAHSIITHNQSPDILFDRSINPYRGCEHGCIYCFARPSHGYMGLSSGLDFETKLFAKPDAAQILERELSKPNYKPKTIAIGTNTDAYQPIEKHYQIMRSILEVLDKSNHPVAIVTKSALITRDCDILARMAERNLVKVAISITTLDSELARNMEPRAATPARRLWTIEQLAKNNIPVSVLVAPMIAGLNDHEMENILQKAKESGAKDAGYIMLRLPYEVAPLFKDWLLRLYPNHYRRVMQNIRDMRGGKDYDANWQSRMTGVGPFANIMAQRFHLARKRQKMGMQDMKLTTSLFKPPLPQSQQLNLFDL